MYTAIWTGKYPCLCYGEWKLYRDGVQLKLPEKIRKKHMNTLNVYNDWHFNADYDVHWETYMDGLDYEDWICANKDWLQYISEPCYYKEIYEAFQKQDWREHSCGGCI